MINELYQLTVAFDQANIAIEHTHPKYKLIPKSTKKDPCVHIILDNAQIYKVERIALEQGTEIKKYGTKQGTFPALNLLPLYRLTDQAEKKMVSDLITGKSTDFNVEEIHQLCREDNWGKKIKNKYHICCSHWKFQIF